MTRPAWIDLRSRATGLIAQLDDAAEEIGSSFKIKANEYRRPRGNQECDMRMPVVLRTMTCFIALILMTLDVTWAGALERCIGPICIVREARTYAQISANYPARKGSVLAMENPERTLCLYDKRNDVSLVLTFSGDGDVHHARVDTLFLAKRNLCIGSGQARRSLPFVPRTESGIAIGSSGEDVEHRLGVPTRKVNAAAAEQTDKRYAKTMYGSKFGAMRLYYEPDEKSLWINEYGVDSDNRVVSILLSNSP